MSATAIRVGEQNGLATEFPKELRRWLREHFGLFTLELRKLDGFKALQWGPWAVLQFIAARWGTRDGGEEAYPSQHTIGLHVDLSERSVRAFTHALAALGVLVIRRERQGDGSEWLYYSPGPTLLAALTELARRYPRGEPEARPRLVRVPKPPPDPTPTPPEATSATPPEATSEEPVNLSKRTSFAPNGGTVDANLPDTGTAESARALASPEEEEASRVRGDSRSIARGALVYRFRRKCPGKPDPRVFHAEHTQLVEAIASELTGSDEERMQAMRDAVDGAWARSKIGSPTVGFIWRSLEDFYAHASEGAAKRLAAKKTRAPAPQLELAPAEDIASADVIAAMLSKLEL